MLSWQAGINQLIDRAVELLPQRVIPKEFEAEARELPSLHEKPDELKRHVAYIRSL